MNWTSTIAVLCLAPCLAGVTFAQPASSAEAARAAAATHPDPYQWNNRAPDPRFNADILVVVAHPDDETMVSAYLAREVLDQGKKVAVVYGTRGDGGNNDVGPEQAMGLGEIREMEARRALATLDITNVWFLNGRDTASQNVLNSLAHWGHGASLAQLVRIVRLTRPLVILTFLPDFTTGENHGDHQAAGVLATEAFDLAGDPAAFPEQISPASNPDANMNLTDGLRPWQPEKIYYFCNPTHDIFTGRGPQYASRDISPARHLSYGMLAAEAFTQHRTQGGVRAEQAIRDHTFDSLASSSLGWVTAPDKLIFGKSLVPSGVTDDVFAGIEPGGVPFHPVSAGPEEQPSHPELSIGDPWNFYHHFWHEHALDHLADIVPYEVTIKVGGHLIIPLIVRNPLDKPIEVSFAVHAPAEWKVAPLDAIAVPAHAQYELRVQAAAPAEKVDGWQNFIVVAESAGHEIGNIKLRAELSTGWVAPQ